MITGIEVDEEREKFIETMRFESSPEEVKEQIIQIIGRK